MLFYLVVQDKDGKQYVKYAEATTRIIAENAIAAQCKEEKLYFDLDQLRIEKSTQRQGGLNTKYYLGRKRNNGKNIKGYERVL